MTSKSSKPTSTSSKTALKSLLKECLRELIEEGVFDNVMTMKESVTVSSPVRHVPVQAGPQSQQIEPNSDFLANFVGGVAREASAGNSQMAELLKEAFMDTAMNTMVNQREGKGYGVLDEHLPAVSSAEQAKMDHEIAQIEALAGPSVHRWAHSAGIKKRQ